MPEISTLDFVLFFIFVILAVVDMNYEFIFLKIFFYALPKFLPLNNSMASSTSTDWTTFFTFLSTLAHL